MVWLSIYLLALVQPLFHCRRCHVEEGKRETGSFFGNKRNIRSFIPTASSPYAVVIIIIYIYQYLPHLEPQIKTLQFY